MDRVLFQLQDKNVWQTKIKLHETAVGDENYQPPQKRRKQE
jgi:hypothetical protein